MIKRKIKSILCIIIIILGSLLIYKNVELKKTENNGVNDLSYGITVKEMVNNSLNSSCFETIKNIIDKKEIIIANKNLSLSFKTVNLTSDLNILIFQLKNEGISLSGFSFISASEKKCYARIY